MIVRAVFPINNNEKGIDMKATESVIDGRLTENRPYRR